MLLSLQLLSLLYFTANIFFSGVPTIYICLTATFAAVTTISVVIVVNITNFLCLRLLSVSARASTHNTEVQPSFGVIRLVLKKNPGTNV